MPWPQLDDFRWAMQEPTNCFTDPELQAGEVVTDMFGMPKMASGNFACVYEINSQNKRWAVRTFNHEVTDQQTRYQLISEHLDVVGLPYMVRFQFQPQGILVGGQLYPIVKMSWVQGMTLTRWVKERCNETETIKNLAKDWRGMIGALYGLQVAHADIQQGNVLVTSEDTLRLVDYDGMFVPSMQGQRAPELGHPNWNHPKRSGETFGPYLDQFPGLVGYLSLLAISTQPSLLDVYCNDENLIFNQTDFSAPRNSALIHELKTIDKNGVKELTEALINWCEHDVNYDTLENIATAGSSPPLTRIGPRASSSAASSRGKAQEEARTKRSPVYAIAAGVLIVAALAGYLLLSGGGSSSTTDAEVASSGQSGSTPAVAGASSTPTNAGEATQNAASSASGEDVARTAEDVISETDPASRTEPVRPAGKASGVTSPPVASGTSAPAAAPRPEFEKASDFYERGKARGDQKDYTGAEADLSKAIAISPAEPIYYRERGNIRFSKGDLSGARLDYDRAIELDSRYSAAYNSRGVLKRRQGDLAGARADYDKAITLNPSESSYYRNRANLRRQQGDLKGAIEDYNQAISLNETDSIAYNSRGVVREAMGDQQGARADYDRAIAINPGEASFYQNRSNLRKAMGDIQGAQADMDRASSLRVQ